LIVAYQEKEADDEYTDFYNYIAEIDINFELVKLKPYSAGFSDVMIDNINQWIEQNSTGE
jgi:hypothetical protein